MHTLPTITWEYRTLKMDVDRYLLGPTIDVRDVSRHLNHLGGEGWELVSMIDVNAGEGRTCDLAAIFKRPAAAPRSVTESRGGPTRPPFSFTPRPHDRAASAPFAIQTFD
ncbi:MAG TPA: DUF4177 domain-containing protein [Longimicrobium sp.]|nr:DUF4177 domain-containing protein [Longimicrobium sp.]